MIDLLTTAADGSLTRALDRAMTFPAGEQHMVEAIDGTPIADGYALVRGTDMNQYALAAMWVDLQHQRGVRADVLIPYLPGARQDRGRPFGAKVYANLINAIGADHVVCLDPHSPVMPGLIERLVTVDSTHIVADALRTAPLTEPLVGVICPDAGAQDRSARVAEALGVPVFQARKHRDFATGRLSGFTCEPLPTTGTLLVADDICDGGGTFRGLAAATGLPAERLALFVSHGVFSGSQEGGAPSLREDYAHVITTDSHPGHARDGVATQIVPALPYLLDALAPMLASNGATS